MDFVDNLRSGLYLFVRVGDEVANNLFRGGLDALIWRLKRGERCVRILPRLISHNSQFMYEETNKIKETRLEVLAFHKVDRS
jgi:hypothetical protein